MIREGIRLSKKALDVCRSEGLGPLSKSVKQALKIRIMMGRRQFDFYTRLRYKLQKLKYTAPANPYKTIDVNPVDVEYFISVKLSNTPKLWGLGQVSSGDWHQPANPQFWLMEENSVLVSLRQRFEEGLDWSDTLLYKKAKKVFESPNRDSFSGYDTLKEFEAIRCSFIDHLFEDIRDNGYIPNYEREHSVPDKDVRATESAYQQRFEPLVVVGEDGQIYWIDGFHRYAIARILNLKSIPVNVLGRHEKWQHVRDTFAEARTIKDVPDNLKKHIGHPDLEDISIKASSTK